MRSRAMLILSCSMTKAGSAWFATMTNELLVAAGHDDNVSVREACGLGDLLEWDTCHLSRPNRRKLRRLLGASSAGHTYCVHVHCGPRAWIRRHLRSGEVRASYIFRDPRDVVVSAYEHGAREREAGRRWTNFAKLRTIDLAIDWVLLRQLPRYSAWTRLEPGAVHLVRYEDLVADVPAELARLAGFLGLRLPAEAIGAVAAGHSRTGRRRTHDAAVHFHKGVPGRFREELTPDQLRRCNRLFARHLARMGYES